MLGKAQRFLEDERTKCAQQLIKAILDIADFIMTIYNCVKIHDAFADCDRYDKFTYSEGKKCGVVLYRCYYFAEEKLTNEQVESNQCFLTQEINIDYNDSNLNTYYYVITILSIIFATIFKLLSCACVKLPRRYQIFFLLIQLIFTLTATQQMYVQSSMVCDGICGIIPYSDNSMIEIAFNVANAPGFFIIVFGLYILYRDFWEDRPFYFRSLFNEYYVNTCIFCAGSIVVIDIAIGIFLVKFKSVMGIEIPFKIAIGIVALISIFGLYLIFSSKKTKEGKYLLDSEEYRKQQEENAIKIDGKTGSGEELDQEQQQQEETEQLKQQYQINQGDSESVYSS